MKLRLRPKTLLRLALLCALCLSVSGCPDPDRHSPEKDQAPPTSEEHLIEETLPNLNP